MPAVAQHEAHVDAMEPPTLNMTFFAESFMARVGLRQSRTACGAYLARLTHSRCRCPLTAHHRIIRRIKGEYRGEQNLFETGDPW